jgi:hypothetical protein
VARWVWWHRNAPNLGGLVGGVADDELTLMADGGRIGGGVGGPRIGVASKGQSSVPSRGEALGELVLLCDCRALVWAHETRCFRGPCRTRPLPAAALSTERMVRLSR